MLSAEQSHVSGYPTRGSLALDVATLEALRALASSPAQNAGFAPPSFDLPEERIEGGRQQAEAINFKREHFVFSPLPSPTAFRLPVIDDHWQIGKRARFSSCVQDGQATDFITGYDADIYANRLMFDPIQTPRGVAHQGGRNTLETELLDHQSVDWTTNFETVLMPCFTPKALQAAIISPPTGHSKAQFVESQEHHSIECRALSTPRESPERVLQSLSAASTTVSPNSGESRLRILFASYGKVDHTTPVFGKSRYFIPDGLSGTHEMYDELWRFEIRHEHKLGTVLITWMITNETSGSITCMTETIQQAKLRETSGRTISNRAVRQALNTRAEEIEASMLSVADEGVKRSLSNTAMSLRPRLCTVGLLFFGLLHESVQKYHNHRTRQEIDGC
jgi:hypothetical protein